MAMTIVTVRNATFDFTNNRVVFGFSMTIWDNLGAIPKQADSYGIDVPRSDTPSTIRTKLVQAAIDKAAELGITLASNDVYFVGYIDRGP